MRELLFSCLLGLLEGGSIAFWECRTGLDGLGRFLDGRDMSVKRLPKRYTGHNLRRFLEILWARNSKGAVSSHTADHDFVPISFVRLIPCVICNGSDSIVPPDRIQHVAQPVLWLNP